MSERSTVRDIALVILACAVFGIHPSATRIAYSDGMSPAFMTIANSVARAGAFVLACIALREPMFRGPLSFSTLAAAGFFQALSIICGITALAYLPGAVVLTLTFTSTLMLLFLLGIRGEMYVGRAVLGSTVAALGGVMLVVGLFDRSLSEISLPGVILSLVAAAATASRLYVFGHETRKMAPVIVGARTYLLAAPVVILVGVFQPVSPPQTVGGWLWVALACASSVGGSLLTLHAIARVGSFRFSLWGKLEPVFTAVFAIGLLGETLSAAQYGGMALVLGSLVAYQVLETRRSV